jgi:uncharacterized protein (TIGR03083 family)
MEIAEHVDALRQQGELLAEATAAAEPDTPVPTCPGWRMRDLLRHIGGVHRWAATYVAEGRPRPMDDAEERRVMAPPAADDDLVDWFRHGHARLIDALDAAPPDLDCWSFLPAPSPLAFWARRQAHETAIHRADAQSHGGEAAITPYPPRFAADGLDELLLGFASRRRRPREPRPEGAPRTLYLHASDAGADWLARIEPERVAVTRNAGDAGEAGDADWSVSGPASDLYLLLWNRRGLDGLRADGDPAALDLWRRSIQVRWS